MRKTLLCIAFVSLILLLAGSCWFTVDQAACCVCEVLPGALRFTEEGDVLGLVAPRALMVTSATKDAFQFSVGEAEKSLRWARLVFRLLGAEEKLRHAIFESGHDYNLAMREAMYGWMTRWLKNEGEGKSIAEPKHAIETPEDLACLTDATRPKVFLFPPSFAMQAIQQHVDRFALLSHDHKENWESTASYMRSTLRKDIFGDFPKLPRPVADLGRSEVDGGTTSTPLVIHSEPGMPIPAILKSRFRGPGRQPACLLLHLDGKKAALEHRLAGALLQKGWAIVAPDLRATGETKPQSDGIAGAPDHNSAEHALWVGRPLLGQWVFDVQCLLDWIAMQPSFDNRRTALIGLDQAGVVAICAGGLLENNVASVLTLEAPTTYATKTGYPANFHMGLLAPGIVELGDIPELAALIAPRRLIVADGRTAEGRKLNDKYLKEHFEPTKKIYKLYEAENQLTVSEGSPIEQLVGSLQAD